MSYVVCRESKKYKVKSTKFVCKNIYVASNGEKQSAHCFLITEYDGKPICRAAQEIFWEDNIENLSLEVDKKTILKLRKSAVKDEKEYEVAIKKLTSAHAGLFIA